MPTNTTKFSFKKPLVNDPVDENAWGGQLNANWDQVDALLPLPAASKFGALTVQSTDDISYEILSGQGTSGQALLSNGADALPSFQTIVLGSQVLLQTQVASASATIDFTSSIDGTFATYIFEVEDVIPATNSQDLSVRMGSGSFDSGASDYKFSYQTIAGTTNTGTASSLRITDALTNAAGDAFSGTFKLSNPSNASSKPNMRWQTDYVNGTAIAGTNGVGMRDTAKAVDRVQFFFPSGNITSGRFTLYGIKNT